MIWDDIAQLKQYGILTREGGRKDGRWVITQSWKILLLYVAITVVLITICNNEQERENSQTVIKSMDKDFFQQKV